jgi:transposase
MLCFRVTPRERPVLPPAWLGMTPRQNSSGGKERLGRSSKRGDKYIRSLLIAGAAAVLRHARNRHGTARGFAP